MDFETGTRYFQNTFIATTSYHVLGIYARQAATLRRVKDQFRQLSPVFWEIPVSEEGMRAFSQHLQHYRGADRPVAWLQLYDYNHGPWREFLPRLNFQRDAIGRQQPVFLAIVGPPELEELFAERAKDLYSIAFHTNLEDPLPDPPVREKLRWLHLSDFHFQARDDWRQRLPLRALTNKLQELVEKDLKPHLVFITGDIAYRGSAAEYEQAYKFLQSLVELLELGPQHFFLVPGNHDVDRTAIKPIHDWLLKPVVNADTLRLLMDDAEIMPILVARQKAFLDFTAQFLGGARGWSPLRPWRADTLEVVGWKVGVMQLNKVWAGGLDSDKGRLYFGERQLLDQLEVVRNCDLTFALCHHPLAYLADFDEQRTRDLLAGQVQFLLRGHLHRNDARSLGAGETLELATGAILEQDPHYVGFTLGELAPTGEGTLHLFRYSGHGQGFWAADTLFSQAAPEGRWSFRIAPRHVAAPAPDPDRLKRHQTQRYRQAVLGYHSALHFIGMAQSSRSNQGPIEKLFVPLALRAEEAGESGELTTPLLEHQLNDEATVRLVVLGEPGSGKTTLCKYLARQLAADSKGKLPLLLPFRRYVQRQVDQGILEFLRDHLAAELALELDLATLTGWLADGEAVLLLDGMDEVGDPLQRATMRDRILAFCGAWPKTSLLLTSRSAGYDEVRLTAPFRHWRLEPFCDQAQEHFARRWYQAQDLPADQAEERANLLIAGLRNSSAARELARNPLLATLLALVHQGQSSLPRQRLELFKKCLETMLVTWPAQRGRPFKGGSPAELQRWLAWLAAWFQAVRAGQASDRDFLAEGPQRGLMVKSGTLQSVLSKELARAEVAQAETFAQALIDHFVRATGVLVEPAAGYLGFVHLQLMEYLAASRLLAEGHDQPDFIIAHCAQAPWFQVCLLTTCALAKSQRDRLIALAHERGDAKIWLFLYEAVREEVPFSAQQKNQILAKYIENQFTEEATAAPGGSSLEQRYQQACGLPGLDPDLRRDFETACGAARIVVNCSVADAIDLATESPALRSHFLGPLADAEEVPQHGPWPPFDDARPGPDALMLGCLSLDGNGLWRQGACTLIVDTEKVAAACTLHQESLRKERDRGLATVWADRHKLCLIKHAQDLVPPVEPADFARILLRPGVPPQEDVFVEVHLHQNLERQSLVGLRLLAQSLSPAERQRLQEKCSRAALPLECV